MTHRSLFAIGVLVLALALPLVPYETDYIFYRAEKKP